MPRRTDPALLRIVQRNCRAFRRELGEDVTQEDVAVLAGLSVSTIGRFEQGEGQPAPQSLAKLAVALGRKMDDFFNPSPPPPDVGRRRFNARVKWIGTPPSWLRDAIERQVAAMIASYDRQRRKTTPKNTDKPK